MEIKLVSLASGMELRGIIARLDKTHVVLSSMNSKSVTYYPIKHFAPTYVRAKTDNGTASVSYYKDTPPQIRWSKLTEFMLRYAPGLIDGEIGLPVETPRPKPKPVFFFYDAEDMRGKEIAESFGRHAEIHQRESLDKRYQEETS